MATSTWTLAFQLALFGVIYRYAVRSDGDDLVKQAAVAMFALFRALSLTNGTTNWNADSWVQLGAYFGESALAFGTAAAALEYAWDKGWASRLWYLYSDGFEENIYGPDLYGRIGGDPAGLIPGRRLLPGPGPDDRLPGGPGPFRDGLDRPGRENFSFGRGPGRGGIPRGEFDREGPPLGARRF